MLDYHCFQVPLGGWISTISKKNTGRYPNFDKSVNNLGMVLVMQQRYDHQPILKSKNQCELSSDIIQSTQIKPLREPAYAILENCPVYTNLSLSLSPCVRAHSMKPGPVPSAKCATFTSQTPKLTTQSKINIKRIWKLIKKKLWANSEKNLITSSGSLAGCTTHVNFSLIQKLGHNYLI